MMKNKSMHKKNLKFNKTYFFTMFFTILILSFYLFYKYNILTEYDEYIYKLKNDIDIAKNLNEELKYQTEYKNSDEYIEKLARDKLSMIKVNEIIFYNKK